MGPDGLLVLVIAVSAFVIIVAFIFHFRVNLLSLDIEKLLKEKEKRVEPEVKLDPLMLELTKSEYYTQKESPLLNKIAEEFLERPIQSITFGKHEVTIHSPNFYWKFWVANKYFGWFSSEMSYKGKHGNFVGTRDVGRPSIPLMYEIIKKIEKVKEISQKPINIIYE